MSDHTPLPWRISGKSTIHWKNREANVELIVVLVKALEKIAWDAYDEADYEVKHNQPTMIWQSVARAALAVVKDIK